MGLVTGDGDHVSDEPSDHEATVEALQRELEQRKQEVKRLRLEQRARQKEQLVAKERIISQQLNVCHPCTCRTNVTLELLRAAECMGLLNHYTWCPKLLLGQLLLLIAVHCYSISVT